MLKIIHILIKNFNEILTFSFCYVQKSYPCGLIQKRKKRFLESESENDVKSTNSYFGNIGKRKRIMET